MILVLDNETLAIRFNSGKLLLVDGDTELVCDCSKCTKHPVLKECMCETNGSVTQDCEGVR